MELNRNCLSFSAMSPSVRVSLHMLETKSVVPRTDFTSACVASARDHGVRHGFKIGGAKTIIELESEPKFNINL